MTSPGLNPHRRAPATAAARRPFVFVNMALSADGKSATANRRVSSFGSPRDHAHLLDLRATADAILCGARTVDLEPITLGSGSPRHRRRRTARGLSPEPVRVVASRLGSLNPAAEVFKDRSSPILVLACQAAPRSKLERLRAVADRVQVFGRNDVDWPRALAWLAEEWGVRRLLVEGGGALNGALFHAGLVDEVHLTFTPWIVGGENAPTLADGPGFDRLADAARFRLHRHRRIGEELFAVYRRDRGGTGE